MAQHTLDDDLTDREIEVLKLVAAEFLEQGGRGTTCRSRKTP